MLANGRGGLRFLVAADLFFSLHFLETRLLLRLASQSFTAGVFQIAFHGTPLVAQEEEEKKSHFHVLLFNLSFKVSITHSLKFNVHLYRRGKLLLFLGNLWRCTDSTLPNLNVLLISLILT